VARGAQVTELLYLRVAHVHIGGLLGGLVGVAGLLAGLFHEHGAHQPAPLAAARAG